MNNTRITLPLSAVGTYDSNRNPAVILDPELVEWLIQDQYSTVHWVLSAPLDKITFIFYCDDDAMLFKLMWGGEL